MIGRPAPTETDPYYFTYIDQVVGDDPRLVVGAQLEECASFFEQISEEKSLQRYAAGKWSIREVLNHITDTERAFSFRMLWFGRGFTTPLPGYDQEIAARGAASDAVSWAGHIEEFRSVRLATITLLKNLPAEAWMRSGIASNKTVTVRALAYIAAGHVTHHTRIIRERYL
jgi:uncharacterized damage-inducible protein DinB